MWWLAKRELKVAYHDNRGDDENPYGYVYFNDETRIGFSPGTINTVGKFGLYPGDWGGGTQGNTPQHFQLAEEFLRRELSDWLARHKANVRVTEHRKPC